MKKLYIIANWKSNKTEKQTQEWLLSFEKSYKKTDDKIVIVCPSFTLLPLFKTSDLAVGSQDISPFREGPYTGAVNGQQIKEYAQYAIVGHSERRKNFGEDDEAVRRKIEQALASGLVPILCMQDEDAMVPDGTTIVVYEPPSAISTNPNAQADSPEKANEAALKIKQKLSNVQYVLYGGSVNVANVHSFTSQSAIDGVLVGAESLEPNSFAEIIKNA